MATRMQQRRGTSEQWTSANPILNVGEIGYETDTNQFKIGDGTNHWDDLAYFLDETALSTSLGDYVETSLLGVPDGVATLNSDGVLDSSQLPDISEITSDTMNDVLIAGSGITKDYDDNGNTITLSVDVSVLDEMSQDAIDAALTAGNGITKDYDDAANTITIGINSNVVATLSDSQTLNNKSINLANNTISGTVSQFNTALSDASFITSTDTGTVTSALIADETIVNADISNTAAIAQSKIADLTTDLASKANLSGATFTGGVNGTNLTLSGNLIVNGTTTNLNSTNLVIEDKNIVLGDTDTPSDATADGGGITLKGSTDKTFNWIDSTDAWTSSEHLNLSTGKEYKINNTSLKNVSETLTNKTIDGVILTGTLTAGGGTGTSGQVLESTANGVQWATVSAGVDEAMIIMGAY